MDIPEGSNYSKWIDKDTIIVRIDLYDENKELIKTVNKYSAIMAVAEDGTFLTFSMPNYRDCSLFFSRQDDLFKAEEILSDMVLAFISRKSGAFWSPSSEAFLVNVRMLTPIRLLRERLVIVG